MAKKSNIAALFILAVIISFFITSCGEDGGTEPQTGDRPTVVTGEVTQIAATTAEGAGEVVGQLDQRADTALEEIVALFLGHSGTM